MFPPYPSETQNCAEYRLEFSSYLTVNTPGLYYIVYTVSENNTWLL